MVTNWSSDCHFPWGSHTLSGQASAGLNATRSTADLCRVSPHHVCSKPVQPCSCLPRVWHSRHCPEAVADAHHQIWPPCWHRHQRWVGKMKGPRGDTMMFLNVCVPNLVYQILKMVKWARSLQQPASTPNLIVTAAFLWKLSRIPGNKYFENNEDYPMGEMMRAETGRVVAASCDQVEDARAVEPSSRSRSFAPVASPAGQNRWVEYAGYESIYYCDPSTIPAEWHLWLHQSTEDPPTDVSASCLPPARMFSSNVELHNCHGIAVSGSSAR